jgi:glycosyltransferase involved in cell wall biosynthesis
MILVEERLKSYIGKIDFKILHHEQNKGLSAARNTGTIESTGDYIYYLDSDDEILPDCINTLVVLAEKYTGVEMVQGNTQTIPEPAKKKDWRNILYKGFSEYVEDNNWVRQHFYCGAFKNIPVNAWNKLIQRDFILENNLFFKEGIIHEDELWMFFVVKKLKSIVFSKEYAYKHHITANSIMQSESKYESIRCWYIILDEIFANIDNLFYKCQRKKYIGVLYHNMRRINFNLKEFEFYFSYKLLVKALLKKNIIRQNIFYAFFLLLLLIPPYFYKSMAGHILYRLYLKLI